MRRREWITAVCVVVSSTLSTVATTNRGAAAIPARIDALPFGFIDSHIASLAQPVAIRGMADGSAIVLEKAGRVQVIRNGVVLPVPALTLTDVCAQSERGLLGIAVDAAFTTNGFVFLYATRSVSGTCVNRVSRFTMAADTIDPTSEVVLVDNIGSPAGNHNGGDLEVGHDGFLYISVGDGGADPRGNSGSAGSNDAARDLSLLNGKILRVDPTTGEAAPGNPYSGVGTASCRTRGNGPATPTTTCREIYASGLRNPWRFAFDPNISGVRFFINDVGQSASEEVNEGILGADYGWNTREGRCSRGLRPPCTGPVPGLTDPLTDYGRADGTFITGGAFVPDGIWPKQFDGAYLFADGGSGDFWILKDGAVDYSLPFHNWTGISDMAFVVNPAGAMSLYYVMTSATDNSVRAITFPFQPVPTPSGPLAYRPIGPAERILDTRRPEDGAAPLVGNVPRVVTTGLDGAATKAVLVNVTYVAPSQAGFVTAWAYGAERPATSNVNALTGEVVANAAVVPVDSEGRIQVLANVGAHVVIDVLGRFDVASGPVAAGRFVPLDPGRVVDTRAPADPVDNSYGETAGVPLNRVSMAIGGRKGVPSSGVSAVVLTVTALSGSNSSGGWVTASPGGAAQPATSNVNVNGSGDIRPNLVVVPLGSDGSLGLYLFQTADVIVDVTGYFTDQTVEPSTSGRFRSLTPYRETDTRTPFGFSTYDVVPAVRNLDPVTVPADAIGVSHNLTIVNNQGAGFLTAFPNEPLPSVSTANASGALQLRAASAFTRLGSDGLMRYFSMVRTDLIIDVTGWFEA